MGAPASYLLLVLLCNLNGPGPGPVSRCRRRVSACASDAWRYYPDTYYSSSIYYFRSESHPASATALTGSLSALPEALALPVAVC